MSLFTYVPINRFPFQPVGHTIQYRNKESQFLPPDLRTEPPLNTKTEVGVSSFVQATENATSWLGQNSKMVEANHTEQSCG